MCGRRGDCKQLFMLNQKAEKGAGQRNWSELQLGKSGSD
jgi:hypothetical protein